MRRASLALVLWLAAGAASANPPTERDLSAGWRFRLAPGAEADAHANLKDWQPAHVPGAVQTDLLALWIELIARGWLV